MSRVVLVSPSGAVLKNLAELGLDASAGAEQEEVTVLTWENEEGPAGVRTIALGRDDSGTVAGRLRRAAQRLLSGSAGGRNLFRLTPWDGGRRLWRATRGNPAATQALRQADLIVAVERDAILTVWKSVHSRLAPRAAAVHGLPAARTVLEESRQSSRPIG